MQQAKQTLGIAASVFGANDPPVNTTIPSTLKGAEIKNFLIFSHQMKIPEGSCIIVKIPMGPKFSYHIIDDDKDMSRFAQRSKNFQILLYPKSIRIRIHCADGRVSTREYPCKTPSSQIVDTVCQDFFHLKHEIAYALYGNINDLYNPISQTKSIIEYDPYLQDVWLLRRFWIQASKTIEEESDIHFNYSHARSIVFAEDFMYQFYDWQEMIAISLTIEYSTYEQTKILLKKEKKDKAKNKKEEKKKEKKEKKEKKKEKKLAKKEGKEYVQSHDNSTGVQIEVSHFPKWMIADKKIKKKKHEIIEKVKNHENKSGEKDDFFIFNLKKKFLELCLGNQFFGALMFPVHCSIPNNSNPPDDYTLSFTDTKIHLLTKGTQTTVFSVDHPLVKKWKPITSEKMAFHFFPEGLTAGKLFEWELGSQNVFAILDYFTSLVNFIKQQSILGTKDDRKIFDGKITQRETTTSFDGIMMGSGLDSNLHDDDSNLMHDEYDQGNNNILGRFDPPPHQAPTFLDVTKITAFTEAELMNEEFKSFYSDETGFAYEPFIYPSLNDNVIESGCALLKSIIYQESLSPVADATSWVQSCLPEDLLTQSVLGWQLQGPTDNLNEAVSTISRCIAYVFQTELTPLDAFVALNYSRSLLLHHARQQWKTIDFAVMAEQVDEILGDVLRPVINITRRLIYPLSSLVFEDSSDILPDARSMLFLNESIAMSLLFSAIAIARALCDAGIGADMLQPVLNTLPVVNTYDPVLAYSLSELLLPILNTLATNEIAQKALLEQSHVAKLDINNIANSITELYNYSHFMASPVAIFCSVRAPRLLGIPETPSTIPEAGYVYQIAREAAVTLWNLGSGKHRALAQKIAWESTSFYSLFIEAARDPSLANQLGLVFKELVDCLQRASEVFINAQNLSDVLDEFDPVHSVILSLLSSEDSKTSLSLLALDSVSAKHRCAVLEDSGKRIDQQLRSLSDKSSPEEIQQISDSFRVFSLMVLSLGRGNTDASSLRVKLNEFGTSLITIMKNDNLKDTERRSKAQDLINMHRGFVNIGQEYNDASSAVVKPEKFINLNSMKMRINSPMSSTTTTTTTSTTTVTTRTATISTNDVPVQMRMPDMSVSTLTLERLAAVLRRFVLTPVEK